MRIIALLIVALIKLLRLLLLALIWWCSGADILPRRRRYARRVHAAWRTAVLLLGLVTLVYGWEITAAVIAVPAAGAATAAVVARRRARRVVLVDSLGRRPAVRAEMITEFPALTSTPAGPAPEWQMPPRRVRVR